MAVSVDKTISGVRMAIMEPSEIEVVNDQPGRLSPEKQLGVASIRIWSEEEFLTAEAEWQNLLVRSDANPLFMSWAWHSCWWRHHSKILNSRLAIYAAYARDGRLIGLAPFHIRKFQYRSLLRGTRVELVGSTFRDRMGAFSEYLDFIVDRRYVEDFLAALKEALCHDDHWSDLVISNAAKTSVAARFCREQLAHCTYLRETDRLVAHVTCLPAEFSEYLKALHPAVRRKLWNHRSKLVEPKLVMVAKDGIAQFLSRLNIYHRQRWGNSPYESLRAIFYLDLCSQLADRDELHMTYLVSGGEPISLMFNVRIGDVEYNVQSGFDHNALPSASLGYLHFGFALEDASASGIRNFNLLAGRGRNRDYKHDFLTAEEDLTTFQMIKVWPLAWLYRCYDRQLFSLLGTSLPYLSSLLGIFEIGDVCACGF